MQALIQALVLVLTLVVAVRTTFLFAPGPRYTPGYYSPHQFLPSNICFKLLTRKCPALKEPPPPPEQKPGVLPTVFLTVEELKSTLGLRADAKLNWDKGVRLSSEELEPGTAAAQASGYMPASLRTSFLSSGSDVCCGTAEVFFVNSTLVDVTGEWRKIAQRPELGAYQFIRHGLCAFQGSCRGTCIQHYIYMPLAVEEPSANSPLTFRFFKLPGYCSCRMVG